MGVSAFVAQNEGAQTYDALHVSSSPDRRASATPGFDLAAGGSRARPRCPCFGHRRRCAAALAPAQARPGRGPRRPT